MPAAGTFACPACGKSYRRKPGMAGKKVGCGCGERFRVPEAPASPAEEDGPLELAAPGFSRTIADRPPANATCSRCNAPLKPDAVLCLNCGTDQRTGATATPPVENDDDDDDDGAPEPTHRRMTATLWGVNAQILSLLAKGLAVILLFVAAFVPAAAGLADAIGLAGGCLGGIGAVLCLAAPTPLAGRLVLAGSLACYTVGFGLGLWDEAGAAPGWVTPISGLLGVLGLLLFLGFLHALAEHLGFPEVTDNAGKVFGTTIGAMIAIAIAWVLPFGSFLVLIGVLALAAWAFWLYASLLIDLSRSVAYRRDRG